MPDSVYKVIEVIGSSATSWEEASKRAVEAAGESINNLRVAEVVKLDMMVQDGQVAAYRAKLSLSFKIDR